jgi:hypothetical protein
VIDRLVGALQFSLESVLEFILTPGEGRVEIPLYGSGTFGLVFLWWGLPASLVILYVLVHGRRQAQVTWAYAGLGLLALSFGVSLVAPNLIMDRYGGLTAWLLLSVPAGYALSRLTKTRRQLLILVPMIMLVCLSTMTSPVTSPQSADQWYHGLLPTTEKDNAALDWVNFHATENVLADSVARKYLVFSRYQSGFLSLRGTAKLTGIIVQPTTPPPWVALFVRCSNTFIACDARDICRTSGSPIANDPREQVVNVLYYNGCDVLEAMPSWA